MVYPTWWGDEDGKFSNLVFEECDNVEFVKGVTMVWMKL